MKNSAVATMIALLLATGTALADRDGRGGGGRGGRDGGRSVSGGNDGQRSSAGSNRSSMRSSDGNRGSRDSDRGQSFSRTFRSDDRDSDGRANRSFDGRGSSDTRGRDADRDGARQYEARRPTNDQVRDFLNLRDNDNDRRNRGDNDNRNRNDNVKRNRDRDRSPEDRALVDREFNQWRNFWNGEKGDGRDHRDWSGNWRNSDRFSVADRIRRDWHGRHDNDFPFLGNWWGGRHRGNSWGWWGDYAHHHNRPNYWWAWATAPRLASWIAFGWPRPYYWDYGPGEYIYYDNGGMYVNGRWYEPAPVFYDRTLQIVEDAPDLDANEASRLDWMPLGVFAATPDGRAEPDVLVQLAVTKDGVIGGTAFDQKSGAAYNIQGMVDKKTQRAVWSYRSDRNQRVMMETSIYNLTQPEATGMVYYGPNDMRVIELVRLEQPQSGDQATGNTSLPAPPAQQ
jgi:hypothetical protein